MSGWHCFQHVGCKPHLYLGLGQAGVHLLLSPGTRLQQPRGLPSSAAAGGQCTRARLRVVLDCKVAKAPPRCRWEAAERYHFGRRSRQATSTDLFEDDAENVRGQLLPLGGGVVAAHGQQFVDRLLQRLLDIPTRSCWQSECGLSRRPPFMARCTACGAALELRWLRLYACVLNHNSNITLNMFQRQTTCTPAALSAPARSGLRRVTRAALPTREHE